MTTRLFSCLLLLLCYVRANAQGPFYYTSATIYGEKEGYRPGLAGGITEDNNGLIWIFGENGLQRFNGTQFKSYSHSAKDSNSLPGNLVLFFYQDKRNTYWLYVVDKGLYTYDPATERFSKYRYKNETVFDLHQSYQFQTGRPFEDSKGRMWVPLLGYGLAEIDRDRNVVVPYKVCIPGNCGTFYNASYVTQIFEDKNGEIWLCTNGGLVHFDPRTGDSKEILEPGLQSRTIPHEQHSVLTFIGPQVSRDIWIGTWGSGIKKLNTVTKNFETFLWSTKTWDGLRNVCTGIWQKDATHLWVTTRDKELFLFNMVTRTFHPVRQLGNEQFIFQVVTAMQAADGSIWMAHVEGPLIKINNNPLFSTYTFTNAKAINPSSLSARSFLKMDNSLYIGAMTDTRLYQYDLSGQTYHAFPLPGKFSRGNIRFLLPVPEANGFYAGGYNGLFFFNAHKQKFEALKTDSIATTLLRQNLICAVMGKNGSIWIGSRDSDKLSQYHPVTGMIKEYVLQGGDEAEHKGYSDHFVTSVATGGDDHIWFTHNHYGLGSIHTLTGKVTFFNSFRNKKYPLGYARSACVAADGSIYFAVTSEGIWRLRFPFTNKEEIINYDKTTALHSNVVRYIHQDRQQRLWLFSDDGLSLFDPDGFKSTNFSNTEGLKSNLFAGPPYEDSSGHIYIGFNNSFQIFNPDSLTRKRVHTSKIIIHDFKVNNTTWPSNVNYATKIRLKPWQTYIQFEFAAITHDNPQQINYSYLLEGFDNDWINVGNNTVGSYNNLPPGDYILNIKANDQVFKLSISIGAYWYKSDWFKLLLAAAFLTLIYVVHRYRLRIVHKEAMLKQELVQLEMRALRAQMNPHFIFNCLSSINRYIVKSDRVTASDYLTRFSKLIRSILDNSATDKINIEQELQSLRLYIDMEQLRYDFAFTYTIEIDESINQKESFIPSMILQPYVENAIWHGLMHKKNGQGKLMISLIKLSDTMLAAHIEDNGIGRQKAGELKSIQTGKEKSYGMQISRDRLTVLNYSEREESPVTIEDLQGDDKIALGTRVTLRIPMQRIIDQSTS